MRSGSKAVSNQAQANNYGALTDAQIQSIAGQFGVSPEEVKNPWSYWAKITAIEIKGKCLME